MNPDPGFVQVPFPDGFRTRDNSFEAFERSLREIGIEPQNVAGVMLETYQGGSAAFAPHSYMQALRQWCTGHKALLVCDEMQAGFGRTGTLWGFEHYGIVPDLAIFGKGISSSLPLSAVAGRPDVMDLHPPLSMTSTHAGNPVCCAAALASIDLIVEENLAENAAKVGAVLHRRLQALAARIPQIGCVAGKGLVAGVALRAAGQQGARWRPGVRSGAPRHGEGRADVRAGGFRHGDRQDLAAAGDHRGGDPRKRRRAGGGFRGSVARSRRRSLDGATSADASAAA